MPFNNGKQTDDNGHPFRKLNPVLIYFVKFYFIKRAPLLNSIILSHDIYTKEKLKRTDFINIVLFSLKGRVY